MVLITHYIRSRLQRQNDTSVCVSPDRTNCFLSYTSRNTFSTLNVFVGMGWGLQCRGWPVDKLHAGVEPL